MSHDDSRYRSYRLRNCQSNIKSMLKTVYNHPKMPIHTMDIIAYGIVIKVYGKINKFIIQS